MGQNGQEYSLKYWATRSSICLFASTTHSFACSALLSAHFACKLRCAHSFACSLTSLTPSLVGKWIIDVSKWPEFAPQWHLPVPVLMWVFLGGCIGTHLAPFLPGLIPTFHPRMGWRWRPPVPHVHLQRSSVRQMKKNHDVTFTLSTH